VSREKLYRYKPVLEIEAAGFEIVSGLLEQLVEAALVRKDKRNRQFLELFPDLAIGDRAIGDRAAGREPGKYETLRLITDYVSGMTDSYAVSTFRRIRGMELPTIY
jgi:dGTPase